MRHFILQRLPAEVLPGPMVSIAGRAVASLRCDPAKIPPFSISFEEASERLAALPGAYVEPDGSFSLRGESDWRIVGNLYDRDGSLLYVELRGDCPAAALSVIIALLGETGESIVVQLPELGVWLDWGAFVQSTDR